MMERSTAYRVSGTLLPANPIKSYAFNADQDNAPGPPCALCVSLHFFVHSEKTDERVDSFCCWRSILGGQLPMNTAGMLRILRESLGIP